MYRNCDAPDLFMSSTKSRTIPPLRVSEELRADAESVLAPGETLSAFVMDAVSRTIDFRKSQLDFLSRGIASAERARVEGGYVPADEVIAGLRKRLAKAQRIRK
jgi:predicted transcriptional regulator